MTPRYLASQTKSIVEPCRLTAAQGLLYLLPKRNSAHFLALKLFIYFIYLFIDCNIRQKIEYNRKNDTIKSNHRVQTGYSKHLRLTRKNRPMCKSIYCTYIVGSQTFGRTGSRCFGMERSWPLINHGPLSYYFRHIRRFRSKNSYFLVQNTPFPTWVSMPNLIAVGQNMSVYAEFSQNWVT